VKYLTGLTVTDTLDKSFVEKNYSWYAGI